jgi:hypothetical protein
LKALEFVERLQRENTELAGRVGFYQAKLQAAEEQLRLLAAPADEPAPPPGPWWKHLILVLASRKPWKGSRGRRR